MNEGIRVVIADSSEDFCKLLSDRIDKEDDISVVGIAADGRQTVSICTRENPDVLVMDLLLKELDGVAVFRALRERGIMARTIVVTSFFNDDVASRLSRLGIDWLMPKPCSISELVSRIRDTSSFEEVKTIRGYDAGISEALLAFGIAPNHNGYHYLVVAAKMRVLDPDALRGITKILYPDVAKRFDTNSTNVERCIREAICDAWKAGDVSSREEYFGAYLQQFTSRPTNSRFISFIAEFVISKRSAEQDENVNMN